MDIPLRQYWALLARYLKTQRVYVTLLVVLLLLTLAVQLINPQIVRWFIDSADMEQPLAVLWQAAAAFIGIAIFEQVLIILATYVSERIGWVATNRLREDLTSHCLKLDMSFHNSHTPGEMIERIDGDVNDLANFFSQFTLVLLSNFLLLVGVLALLWWEDWRIGLVISLIALLALFFLDRLRQAATPHWRVVRQATAELYGFLEERFRGLEDIQANGLKDYVLQQLYRLSGQLLKKQFKVRQFQAASLALPIFVFGLAYTAAYLLGNQLFSAGQLSLGSVYLIFHYLGLLSSPLWQIVNEVQSLQRAGGSINRIHQLSQRTSQIQGGPGVALPDGPLSLYVENLSFGYNANNETVLTDVGFRLQPGEVLGLLGRTGSGKSTLIRLLFRLYDPGQGEIRVGHNGRAASTNIRSAKLSELRRRIGLVTQEVQLFQATIRDNLTFFDPAVSDAQIIQVIEMLGLSDWFARLPAGLETMLDASGANLSAGEGQLLAFMRVFLQDPGLVILDEAASRLDPATEHLVDGATQRLLQNRTGIVIAHRLKTVQQVDKVLILANGRVQEYGHRAALANDPNSHFYRLLQIGRLDFDEGEVRNENA